jgi:hypothetical protein
MSLTLTIPLDEHGRSCFALIANRVLVRNESIQAEHQRLETITIKRDKRSKARAFCFDLVYPRTELFLLSLVWHPVIASMFLFDIIGMGEHGEIGGSHL